ncbi:MAG: hypothetical protein ACRBFS_20925 [Aureispira sp.]
MYKELQDYLIALGTSHTDITATLLSHQLTKQQEYHSLTGSILEIDGLTGKLSGQIGSSIDATQYLTISIGTLFKDSEKNNLTTEGYHRALDISYTILFEFLAKLEHDLLAEECPIHTLDWGSVTTYEAEPTVNTWAAATAVIPYTIENVINHNPLKWQ